MRPTTAATNAVQRHRAKVVRWGWTTTLVLLCCLYNILESPTTSRSTILLSSNARIETKEQKEIDKDAVQEEERTAVSFDVVDGKKDDTSSMTMATTNMPEADPVVHEVLSASSDTTLLAQNQESATNTAQLRSIPRGPMCLVHVGKTAGSLLACAVGYPLLTCPLRQQQQQQQLDATNRTTASLPSPRLRTALRTGGHSHLEHFRCHPSAVATLVTVRHPIERIQSWFYYDTQGKHRDCYNDSFADLVADLPSRGYADIGTNNNNTSDAKSSVASSCPQVAWEALTGKKMIGYHSYYNYEWYWNLLLRVPQQRRRRRPMVVVRTEHVAQDINQIHRMLLPSKEEDDIDADDGRPGDALARLSTNRGPKTSSSRNNDSTSATNNIDDWTSVCRALCRDIQYYKRFLFEASNLTPEDVQDSMAHVQQYCPNVSTSSLQEDECEEW